MQPTGMGLPSLGNHLVVMRRYLRHLAHVTARLCAPAAHGRALFHLIAIEGVAGLRTSIAYLGAGRAFSQMVFRAPRHEVGRRLAGLNAIIHNKRVVMPNMSAAHIEAMIIKSVLTGVAALPAQFDANLDMFRMISHDLHSLINAMPH
jgi:hypothetical protein